MNFAVFLLVHNSESHIPMPDSVLLLSAIGHTPFGLLHLHLQSEVQALFALKHGHFVL